MFLVIDDQMMRRKWQKTKRWKAFFLFQPALWGALLGALLCVTDGRCTHTSTTERHEGFIGNSKSIGIRF